MTETTATNKSPQVLHREMAGAILDELKENKVGFEIIGAFYSPAGFVLKLGFDDIDYYRDSAAAIRKYLDESFPDYTYEITGEVASLDFQIRMVAPTGIPFSSEDEKLGEEPKDRAIKLVKGQLEDEGFTADSIYVVWFAYVVGNWKALVSTSLEDGRYYEVTYNKSKGETYVDTYIKHDNRIYFDKESNA